MALTYKYYPQEMLHLNRVMLGLRHDIFEGHPTVRKTEGVRCTGHYIVCTKRRTFLYLRLFINILLISIRPRGMQIVSLCQWPIVQVT